MQKIGNVPRVSFLLIAEEVMARFLALPANPKPERAGGFMAVLDKSVPKMLFVNELGICHPELAERCFGYCQEKVRRLLANEAEGHVSSWQSRDEENHQYGGAVRAPAEGLGASSGKDLIGAVSGLVEHGDEAVTLVIWMIFRWVTLTEAKQIVEISQNPYFEQLLKNCNDLFDKV